MVILILIPFRLGSVGLEFEEDQDRILILGDSHVSSISTDNENVETMGVSSSGLVRRDFFDWITWSSLNDKAYSKIFIILGTNDGQSFLSQGNYDFGTLPWEMRYLAHIEALIAALPEHTYCEWMMIPPRNRPFLHRKIEYINALIKEVCQRYGINVSYPLDRFDQDDVYQPDGIHLTKRGTALLMERMGSRINNLADSRLP